ncbi:unnamed protein product [Mytilus coruscus]|uniref:THAP-type domain-containing protein n=1 Tax=Mytilus coruscus TaxID=42192 RepID=A0A6J8BTK6_MYTCO|nr:unnamed protein product [Mytilus coruscus]
MGKRCAVAGCSNSTKTGHSVHLFPKVERQRVLWIRFVKLTRVDFSEPSKNSAICSAHFSDECYEVDRIKFKELFGLSTSKRLLPNSVPSIYPKRSADVLNEGFIAEPKKKLRTSAALQKRERVKILQELLYNPPNEETKNPPELIPTVPMLIDDENANPSLEPSADQESPVHVCNKSVPSLVSPEQDTPVCSNSVPSPVSPEPDKPIYSINASKGCNSDSQETTHSKEIEKVNVTNSQKTADSQTATVSTQRRFRSARIQVHPKTKEKCTQADFQPRYRSMAIQCDLIPTPHQPQPADNTTERVQQHANDIEHIIPDDPVISDDPEDLPYEPSLSDSSDSGGSDDSHNELETGLQEKKYIVSEDQLMDLFKICRKCCGCAIATISQIVGTLIKVEVKCELCSDSYVWHSQSFIGSVPTGNLAVSSAILFSGALPTKVLRFMNFMNIATISNQTFFNHQRHFLYPAVVRFWKHQQTQHVARYRDGRESLVIGGDGRADTPGHSAKYGSYSMVDLNQGVVIDVQLVQSNEVKSSNAMEKRRSDRALKWIDDNNLSVKTLVTDQHLQIVKFKEKMVKLSKETDCAKVGEWIKSITNHMYWVAASTPAGDGEEMVSKWLSVANHVQNIHTGHSDTFPSCKHRRLVGRDRKKWLKPGSKACVKAGRAFDSYQTQNICKKAVTNTPDF